MERPRSPESPRLVESWLDLSLPTLPENLALDEALLIEAEAGGPSMLRLWEWLHPAVVLGASGRLGDEVELDALEADGVELARRSSGGGTVLLGEGALNVTLVLPLEIAPGLGAVEQAQAFVLERIAESIRERTGKPVEVRGSGDLTVAGKKCAGSAQRRLRRVFLVHASILYAADLGRMARYLKHPRRQPAYREGRSHADFVTNLGLARGELVEAIQGAWLGPKPFPEPAIWRPRGLIQELVATKFGDPAHVRRF